MSTGKEVLNDFCNLYSCLAIYSSNDDYTDMWMTNVNHEPVTIGKHVIIGCGSVILPNVSIDEGCAIGSLALVKSNCESFGVYAGNPIKRIKDRSRRILELEETLLIGEI